MRLRSRSQNLPPKSLVTKLAPLRRHKPVCREVFSTPQQDREFILRSRPKHVNTERQIEREGLYLVEKEGFKEGGHQICLRPADQWIPIGKADTLPSRCLSGGNRWALSIAAISTA